MVDALYGMPVRYSPAMPRGSIAITPIYSIYDMGKPNYHVVLHNLDTIELEWLVNGLPEESILDTDLCPPHAPSTIAIATGKRNGKTKSLILAIRKKVEHLIAPRL